MNSNFHVQNPAIQYRNWDVLLILLVFFATRLLFFYWLTTFSSIYHDSNFTAREPSLLQNGIWADDARKILSGGSATIWEDVGMTYLMVGLHSLGIPLRQTFFWACLILSVFGFTAFCSFYAWLKDTAGLRRALPMALILVLYPPGIYYSFYNVVRILPVYVSLTMLALVLHSSRIFGCLNARRLLYFVGIGVYLTFMILARKSNNVIVFAGLFGLAVTLFSQRQMFRRYILFALIVLAGYKAGLFISRQNQHLVWHSLYNALGDFDRKYNFVNNDDFSLKSALLENPDLARGYDHPYDSPTYESTLRSLFFRAIKLDPQWYASILIKRSTKLLVVPFQGSWVVPASPSARSRIIQLDGLFDGVTYWRERLYITVKTLTAGIDFVISLIGFFGLIVIVLEKRGQLIKLVPFFAILSSVLYVYILIGSGNRTLYLAGTYFYLFFALNLGDRIISRMFRSITA